jgi:hypothetical protein
VTVDESPLAVPAAPEYDGVELVVEDPLAGAVTVSAYTMRWISPLS